MKLITTTAFGLLLVLLPASANPRVALVRVTDIYRELPSTRELQKRVRSEQEAVLNDERAAELRRMLGELQALEARRQEHSTPADEEGLRALAREFEMKRQETQTLQEEFENFRRESYNDINARMVRSMRASLDLIVEVSRKLAMEQGYDNVFDSSGNTNTGVPFLLYAKDAPDLSDDVKAALKDLAAREEAANDKPAETAAPGETEASAGDPPSAPDQP